MNILWQTLWVKGQENRIWKRSLSTYLHFICFPLKSSYLPIIPSPCNPLVTSVQIISGHAVTSWIKSGRELLLFLLFYWCLIACNRFFVWLVLCVCLFFLFVLLVSGHIYIYIQGIYILFLYMTLLRSKFTMSCMNCILLDDNVTSSMKFLKSVPRTNKSFDLTSLLKYLETQVVNILI